MCLSQINHPATAEHSGGSLTAYKPSPFFLPNSSLIPVEPVPTSSCSLFITATCTMPSRGKGRKGQEPLTPVAPKKRSRKAAKISPKTPVTLEDCPADQTVVPGVMELLLDNIQKTAGQGAIYSHLRKTDREKNKAAARGYDSFTHQHPPAHSTCAASQPLSSPCVAEMRWSHQALPTSLLTCPKLWLVLSADTCWPFPHSFGQVSSDVGSVWCKINGVQCPKCQTKYYLITHLKI